MNKNAITNFVGMFKKQYYAKSIDASKIDTSYATTVAHMFSEDNSITYLNLNNFKTSNVTNMNSMLHCCTKLISLDISSFDFSNAENVLGMFSECTSLKNIQFGKGLKKSIDLHWSPLTHESALSVINGLAVVDEQQEILLKNETYRTLSADDIQLIESKNWKIKEHDLSEYEKYIGIERGDFIDHVYFSDYDNLDEIKDTRNIVSLKVKLNFSNHLDLSYFTTHGVIYMDSMFEKRYCATAINVSNFDTSNVIDMNCMFYECDRLKHLDISNFDFTNVTNTWIMFRGCKFLTDLQFGKNLSCDLDLSDCPLTHESILTVIDGLADTAYEYTLIINKTTYATLTADEIKLVKDKNWEIVA